MLSKQNKVEKAEKKSRTHDKKGKHVVPRTIDGHLRTMNTLIPKLKALERPEPPRKNGWFVVATQDAKSDSELTAALKKEFGFVRTTARAILGNREFRTRAPMTFTLTTTVTSGVTALVATGGQPDFGPTDITEQSSFAAIFDEVKVHGGRVDFVYTNGCSPNAGSITVDARPVIGYDPQDNTVAASCSAVIQLAQHKTLDVALSSAAHVASAASSNHHIFDFIIPKGTMVDVGDAFCGDVWQDTANAQSVGAIKFYHVGSCVTAVVTGAGHLILDLSYRCRS